MTEEEWRDSADSHQMLDYLATRFIGAEVVDGFRTDWVARAHLDLPHDGRGEWQGRKFCLFNAACCRRVWRWLTARVSQRAVEVAERFADGLATERERMRVFDAAGRPPGGQEQMQSAWDAHEANPDGWIAYEAYGAAQVAVGCVHCDDWYYYGGCARITARAFAVRDEAAGLAERAAQADLIRDLFGSLFRPAVVDPAWLAWNGGVAARMAEDIYRDRSLPEGLFDQDRLAVLSDALEDAGC